VSSVVAQRHEEENPALTAMANALRVGEHIRQRIAP
jgi:hypothetical protein